jgi:hypothetical protein
VAPVNGKFRSRKFSLAVASFVIATLGAALVSATATVLLISKRGGLTPDIWLQTQSLVLYFWLFTDAAILAGYGIPNVVEKWSPKGGGV